MKHFDACDVIDTERSRRAREMSATYVRLSKIDDYPFAIASKAIVVLAYACWEGFYNHCAKTYIDFLAKQKILVADNSWDHLLGTLASEFESLRSRNFSKQAKREFLLKIDKKRKATYSEFETSTVMSRSNLDFTKLRDNLDLLSINISPMLRHRLRIDKELVQWRHAVAHGDAPDLSTLDMLGHIKFTNELLLILSDLFQEKFLELK